MIYEYSLSSLTDLMYMLTIVTDLLAMARCQLGYLLHNAHFLHVL